MQKFIEVANRLMAVRENSDSWRAALSLAHDMMDGYSDLQMESLEVMVEVMEQKQEIKVGDKIRSFDFPHTDEYYEEGVVELIVGGVIKFGQFVVNLDNPSARVVRV